MHVLVIPSWYPQFEGDPGGSFFREQAIELTNYVNHVGVLFLNQRSLRNVFKFKAEKNGIYYGSDNGVSFIKRNAFNLTPRIEYGIFKQWITYGYLLFEKYVEKYGVPDIIHAHCALYAGILAFEIKKRKGIPYVVTEHSTGYFDEDYSAIQLNWAGNVFENSAANIAVSTSLKKILVNKYCLESKWSVIPNIVENSFFKKILVESNESNVFKFLNVAMLKPIKRHDLLIDAFLYIREKTGKNFELTIVGEGPERRYIENKIVKLNLEKNVHLLGQVQRSLMPEIMANHDAFVLTSDYETFGVVVAEALATGLPCIVTNCGGPEDIIGELDGISALVGDFKSIGESMIQVSERFDVKRLDARNSRRKQAFNRFGGNAVCTEILGIYEKILSCNVSSK